MRSPEEAKVRSVAAAMVRSIRNGDTFHDDALSCLHFEAGALYGMNPPAYPDIARALNDGARVIRRARPCVRPVHFVDTVFHP